MKYKSIAEVNEDALKEIEKAHEKFKIEVFQHIESSNMFSSQFFYFTCIFSVLLTKQADNGKKVLESELNSLREKMLEIENESSLKYEEVASETVGKEEALTSAMAEITNLKEEILTKS